MHVGKHAVHMSCMFLPGKQDVWVLSIVCCQFQSCYASGIETH